MPGGRNGWAAVGVDEFLRAYMQPRGRAAFYAALRNIYLDEPEGDEGFWTRLRALEHESLFVWGKQDRLVPIAFARHVREALPGAQHVELDCGHVPQLEAPRETHAASAVLGGERRIEGRVQRSTERVGAGSAPVGGRSQSRYPAPPQTRDGIRRPPLPSPLNAQFSAAARPDPLRPHHPPPVQQHDPRAQPHAPRPTRTTSGTAAAGRAPAAASRARSRPAAPAACRRPSPAPARARGPSRRTCRRSRRSPRRPPVGPVAPCAPGGGVLSRSATSPPSVPT